MEIKIYNNNEVLSAISHNFLLCDAFNYILNNSKSNTLPYHNLKHSVDVLGMCMTIEPTSSITLKLAALFHDFNHSGGELSDEDNVQMAIDGITDYYNYGTENLTEKALLEIIEIIEATQYPYIIDKKDLTKNQSIIRDADLMVSMNDGFWSMGIFGLMDEMKIEDINSMVKGQISFHNSIELTNPTAKYLYDNNWSFLDTLNSFSKILKIK
jgi:hypothetical protein